MNKDERDVIDLMKEWKNDIKRVTEDYNQAIGKVDLVRKELENKKKGWIQRHQSVIYPCSFFLAVVAILIILNVSVSDWCSLEYGDLKITKKCISTDVVE